MTFVVAAAGVKRLLHALLVLFPGDLLVVVVVAFELSSPLNLLPFRCRCCSYRFAANADAAGQFFALAINQFPVCRSALIVWYGFATAVSLLLLATVTSLPLLPFAAAVAVANGFHC